MRGGDWNTPISAECTPKTLDWDLWLGPAPKRPFDPERFFRFRKYWDYSGGVATDLISHVLSAAQICCGPEFPHRVSAAGGIYVAHDRETPDTFSMQVEYPSEYMATLFCTQATTQGVDFAIRGEKASLRIERGERERGRGSRVVLTPEEAFGRDVKPEEVFSEPRQNHDENFVHCMRTREKPHCDPLTGYKVTVALALAVKSWREGKMFTFDAEKQQLV
jgi:predicted dehydrogenase